MIKTARKIEATNQFTSLAHYVYRGNVLLLFEIVNILSSIAMLKKIDSHSFFSAKGM